MEDNRLYNLAFAKDEDKVKAFDDLAALYFNKNFGTLSKSEIDLFMFSQLVENLYENTSEYSNYSDYTLAKALGITPSKVASLKTRKEIKYPSKDYNWRTAFLDTLGNAEVSGDKVALYIRDARLYEALREEIDRLGGYSEGTLTKQLITVSFPLMIDIVAVAAGEETQKKIKKQIIKILKDNQVDLDKIINPERPFMEITKSIGKEAAPKVMKELLSFVSPLLSSKYGKVAQIINKIIEIIGN